MKHLLKIVACVLLLSLLFARAESQCSLCTKTAQQLGKHAGSGLNTAILYLAALPFSIVSFIAYRWWKLNSGKD